MKDRDMRKDKRVDIMDGEIKKQCWTDEKMEELNLRTVDRKWDGRRMKGWTDMTMDV